MEENFSCLFCGQKAHAERHKEQPDRYSNRRCAEDSVSKRMVYNEYLEKQFGQDTGKDELIREKSYAEHRLS